MSLIGNATGRSDAVEVVVDAGAALDEQRRRDAAQVEFRGQVQLEEILEMFDGALGLGDAEQGAVAAG